MGTSGQLTTFRALIADDDNIVRRVLSGALSEEGFQCDCASDGEHALNLLSNEPQYDLLVADLRMPGKNGHSLSIEALKTQPQLVVMVHTAVEEPRLTKDLILRGVDDVVLKPTNYPSFAAKARGFVARRHQRLARDANATAPRASGPRDASTSGSRSDAASGADEEVLTAAKVQQRLNEMEHLFPLSHVAFDVYSMATREDSEPEEMAATIEQDASLTAEVLKLANSSHTASRQTEIANVEQAIVRLGRRSIGQLALSAGGRQALAGHEVPWIDQELLWKRSLLSAVALRTLKAKAAVHADSSEFLGTLLHPVGRIVLATLFPAQHRKLTEGCRESGESLELAEEKMFGFTHGQIGARLLISWGISPAAAQPLEHVATPFSQLLRHPEEIRCRAENVKLSILLARMAVCRWEPWDTVDLPSQDVFERLNVHSVAETLFAIRDGLDSPLPNAGEGPTDGLGTPDRRAAPEVVYRTPTDSPLDVLPSLLSSLGVQLLEHTEDDRHAVVINGLVEDAGLKQLIASETSASLVGVVRREQAATLFPEGAAVSLPTTASALLEALRTGTSRAQAKPANATATG